MRSHFAHFTCCWPDTPLCHHLSSDCECKFSGYILVPSRLFQVFSGFPGTKVDWPDTFLCHHSSSSCCRLQMPVLPIYFGPTSTISGFKGSTSVFSFRVEQVCTFHLLTLLCATIHHHAAGCTFWTDIYIPTRLFLSRPSVSKLESASSWIVLPGFTALCQRLWPPSTLVLTSHLNLPLF